MTPQKSTRTEPQILEMPAQKMAVVFAKGAPDKVFAEVMPALYGSVYTLKMSLKKEGKDFKVGAPRARYPDAQLALQTSWTIITGLPVPEDTTSLPQKVSGTEVGLETWEYGTVAQILYLGPYNGVGQAIEQLHQFVKDNGYEIAGTYEEEYLSRPNVKVPRTLIRFAVRKK